MTLTNLEFSDYDAYVEFTQPNPDVVQALIAYEDEQTKPKTEPLPAGPQKYQVPTPAPYETSPSQFGDYFVQSDFSHGAGQVRFHSEGRDSRKYAWSEGYDISKPGRLKPLHAVLKTADVNIGRTIEICNDLPFYIKNTGTTRVQRGDGNFPPGWTGEDPGAGATTVDDLTTSGDELYAAQTNIKKRSSAGVWSNYVTAGATAIDRIQWIKSRLIASDGRNIYEITAGGALPTAMETLPTGWRFEDIFEYGEFIYACAVSTLLGESAIYRYGLNQAGTALEARGRDSMPRGELIYTGSAYLGIGYLGGGVKVAGAVNAIVYQCVQDARGALTIIKVAEDQESTTGADRAVRALEPYGESMYMGWSTRNDLSDILFPPGSAIRSGLAVHHLGRDAFAKHLAASTTTSELITSIRTYKGRLLFAQQGVGFCYEDTANWVATAQMLMSVIDYNNPGQKVWDLFKLEHSALPSGWEVKIDAVGDAAGASTFTLSNTTLNSLSKEGYDTSNGARGSRLEIFLTTTPAAGNAEFHIQKVAARSLPTPATPEYILTRNFRLFEADQKDEQAQPVFGNPDADKAALDSMINKWVTVYEAGKTWTAFVMSVTDITPMIPIERTSEGSEPTRKGYVVQMQMVAR
jgi:hypothetical protein